MSFFKLFDLFDDFKEVYSPGPIVRKPESIFKERKPSVTKVIDNLIDGNIEEAFCEASGVNAIKESYADFEKHSNLYKKTNKTVKLDYFDCEGAIVFCELIKGVEHSGIYIGKGDIVELNGDGLIRKVSPVTFYSDSQYRTGTDIYTFTDLSGKLLCSNKIAKRAKEKIGTKVNYNVALNNCHKFTAGCITGNFNNTNLSFTQLMELFEREFGTFEIRKVKL